MNQVKKEMGNSQATVLFPLQHKIQLEDFIDQQIIIDYMCSETLTDLYQGYITFMENQVPHMEPLKRRAFKNNFMLIFKDKGVNISQHSNNRGIIIGGIGLKQPQIRGEENEEKEKELVHS